MANTSTSLFPRYTGGKQQRCIECGEACSWACAICSTPTQIFALHPLTCGRGNKCRRYMFFAAHKRAPQAKTPVAVALKRAPKRQREQ